MAAESINRGLTAMPDLSKVACNFMKPTIRQASYVDLQAMQHIVDAASKLYTARIGRPPGPMTDDYAAPVA